MTKTIDTDFLFLYKLSSLYNAVTFSVSSPVAVPSGLGDGASTFGRIFYDCADDEDAALRTMQERFRVGSGDIRKHLDLHAQMRDGFYDVDEGINAHNRGRVVVAAEGLANNTLEYCAMVAEHMKRLGEEAFLDFPTCVPGHYFMITGDSRILGKSFNPQQSYEGAVAELDDLKSVGTDFRIAFGRIPQVRISDQQDTGEGINDVSLRGRLDLTKELLKRAGFAF